MAHVKLSFAIGARDCDRVEAALIDAGAQSVGYFDAGDAPIHEPAPGETPLWPAVKVEALYADDADPLLVEAVLRARCGSLPAMCFTRLDDRIWEREWLRDFRCMRFGRRLWVCPDGQRPTARDAVVVDLDPGLAFGTGTHATTAMCLEWLDGAALTDRSVLDFGCGSGILAIAALRLGADRALAIDIDPQARIATSDNARRNRVHERLEIRGADTPLAQGWDVVIANILARPLIDLAPTLARAAASGGSVVLSGILADQLATVTKAYAPWFDFDAPAVRDGWARVSGRRSARHACVPEGATC